MTGTKVRARGQEPCGRTSTFSGLPAPLGEPSRWLSRALGGRPLQKAPVPWAAGL